MGAWANGPFDNDDALAVIAAAVQRTEYFTPRRLRKLKRR